MLQIIPNLHPLFVHFTVALVVISFGMLMIAWFFKYLKIKINEEMFIVSRWSLWLSSISATFTVAAGIQAYFNVSAHDVNSHTVMLTHRNWALTTLVVVLLMTFWSIVNFVRQKYPNLLFSICMTVPFILVLITGYYGTELVYRYGVGVIPVSKIMSGDIKKTSTDAWPGGIQIESHGIPGHSH